MDAGRMTYRIEQIMNEKNLDAIIVTDQYSMRYIASYRGEGVVVYSRTGRYVITDSRYTEQVERECPDYHCVDIAGIADHAVIQHRRGKHRHHRGDRQAHPVGSPTVPDHGAENTGDDCKENTEEREVFHK